MGEYQAPPAKTSAGVALSRYGRMTPANFTAMACGLTPLPLEVGAEDEVVGLAARPHIYTIVPLQLNLSTVDV